MSVQATADSTAAEGAGARRLTERIFRIRELGIVVALAILIAVTAAWSRASSRPTRFARWRSTRRSSRSWPWDRRS